MEGIYLLLAVIFLGTMIYVLISSRINQLVDNRLREFYETTIKRDMQDFYREIESYTSMLENRVSQMKQLLDRQEKNTHRFESSVHLAKQIDPAGESAQFLTKLNEIGVEKKEPAHVSMPQQSFGFEEEPETKQEIAQTPPPVNEEPVAAQDFSPARVPKYSTYAAQAASPAPNTKQDEKTSFNDADLDALLESTVKPDSLASSPPPRNAEVQQPPTPAIVSQASEAEQGPWVLEPVRKLGKSIATVFNMNGAQPAAPVAAEAIPDVSFRQQLNENVVIVPEPPAPASEPAPGPAANAAFLKDLKENLAQVPQDDPADKVSEAPAVMAQENLPLSPPAIEDTPKPSSILSKNVDEFMVLVSQIRRRENRHEALKKLLDQNIPMDKIAEFADVPVGELEVLRNVHRL